MNQPSLLGGRLKKRNSPALRRTAEEKEQPSLLGGRLKKRGYPNTKKMQLWRAIAHLEL